MNSKATSNSQMWYIIYYDDEIPFRKGDTIALQWKMDSIDIAGEVILSFEEWYVSGKKIGHKTKK